jgi:hypothetical protein
VTNEKVARRRLHWSLLGWGWVGLGFVGTTLATLASPAIVGAPVNWWFNFAIAPGTTGNRLVFYFGVALVTLAWLAIGRRIRDDKRIGTLEVASLGLFWSLPLLVAPPMFSSDLYSYLAQGAILHLGLDPYHSAPLVLSRLGEGHLLRAVSPFWRSTTAPYGPSFIGLMSLLAAPASASLELGVVLARLFEVLGVAAIAVSVPALARTCGANSSRALWLTVASPLVLFQLVAAGHNDALMAGLMVLGVTAALSYQQPLLGIALCVAAASVKVPAGIAALFLTICWVREQSSRRAKAIALSKAVLVGVVVLLVISWASGLGAGWLSTSVLATPGRVHLAITPVSQLGWVGRALLSGLGVHVALQGVVGPIGDVALGLSAALAVVLAWRVRFENLVVSLGSLLLVLAFLGPAAWPWYFCWGLVLVACSPLFQRSQALPAALVASVFVVKPDGILLFHFGAAPYVLGAYAVIGALAFAAWHRSHAGSDAPLPLPADQGRSAIPT